MHRREFGKACLAGAITLAPRAAGADPTDTIRFGFLYPNLTTIMHGVATSIGAYEKRNLNVTEQRFTSGQSADGVQALWQGDIDLYFGGGPEAPDFDSRAIEAGMAPPLAVLSGANAGHTNFVLSNRVRATKFDDLVGRNLRVAVSSPSSDHLALFRGWLRIDKHMTVERLGWQILPVEGADMPTALLTNQIDGFLHSEPTTSLVLISKSGYLFMSGRNGDFGADPPPMTFVMGNRAFLKKNPDAASRFMAALFEANEHYAHASEDANIALISKWSGVKPTVLKVAYPRINPIVSMTHAQAQKWWDYVGTAMVARGELSKQMDPFRDVFALQYQPLPSAT